MSKEITYTKYGLLTIAFLGIIKQTLDPPEIITFTKQKIHVKKESPALQQGNSSII